MSDSDKELLAQVSALILPLIISLAQQPTWSSRRRAMVGFAGVLLWTLFGAMWLGDGIPNVDDWRSWVRLLLSNIVVAAATFFLYWKPSGVSQRVEAATSPPSHARRKLIEEAERKETPPRSEGGP